MSEKQQFEKDLAEILKTWEAANGEGSAKMPTLEQLKESEERYRENKEPKITVLTKEQAAKMKKKPKAVDHVRKSANFAYNKTKKEMPSKKLTYDIAKVVFWNNYKGVIFKETGQSVKKEESILRQFPDIVKWGIDDISGRFNPYKSLYIWGGLGIGKSTIAHALSLMTTYNALNFSFKSKRLGFVSMDEFFLKILESESLTGLSGFSRESAIIIDELRIKHFKYKHYGNEINLIAEILNARHSIWKRVGVQTVITSNIPKELLREELNDERLFDRILQQYEFIEITGSNKRRLK